MEINLTFVEPCWVCIKCDFSLMQTIKTFIGCQYSLKDKLWKFHICYLYLFIKYVYSVNLSVLIKYSDELNKKFEEYNNKINYFELLKTQKYDINQKTYFKNNNNYKLTETQLQGAYWLTNVKKGILAFDVGVGKTYSSLEAASIVNNNSNKKIIIITLASLISQWKEQMEQQYDIQCFSIKEFKKQKLDNNGNVVSEKIVQPNSEQRKLIYNSFFKSNDFSALVINYELVRIDFELLKKIKFDIAIIDEASKVKSTSSFNTTNKIKRLNNRGSIRELLKNTEYIFGLSATPFETFLHNLYGIFNVINPDYFSGGYSRFVNRYMKQDRFGGWSLINKQNFEEIKELVKPYMFYKKQELDVKIDIHKVDLNFTEQDLLLYQKIIEDTTDEMQKKIRKKNNETMEEYLDRLQEAIMMSVTTKRYKFVDFPQLVYPKSYLSDYISPKANWLLENYNNLNGKTIIFDSRTQTTEILRNILSKNSINYYIIDGSISLKNRNVILEKFKNDADIKILICSDCLSYGINLQFASNIINFNLLFNPSAIQQRQGRIIRKGQLNNVNIYFLQMNKTFEESIYNKLDYRSKIASDIFDNNFLDRNKKRISRNKMLQMIYDKGK